MFLQLNHKKLDAYILSKSLIVECYRITSTFPAEEKFGLVSQIRRAACSILLYMAEGASRESMQERHRFYEISRSSLVEVDTAFEVSKALGYLKEVKLHSLETLVNKSFQHLTGMVNGT